MLLRAKETKPHETITDILCAASALHKPKPYLNPISTQSKPHETITDILCAASALPTKHKPYLNPI